MDTVHADIVYVFIEMWIQVTLNVNGVAIIICVCVCVCVAYTYFQCRVKLWISQACTNSTFSGMYNMYKWQLERSDTSLLKLSTWTHYHMQIISHQNTHIIHGTKRLFALCVLLYASRMMNKSITMPLNVNAFKYVAMIFTLWIKIFTMLILPIMISRVTKLYCLTL